MPTYIVNTNPQPGSRDHEVHVTPRVDCSSPRYPNPENQESLGYFSSCHGAVEEAKRRGYRTANGCYYCANACHTG